MVKTRFKGRRGQRLHYIPDWAERRRMRQVDVVEALEGVQIGVDKSTVSRWFGGSMPEERHLLALAALFALDEPAALFQHPDADWLSRALRKCTEDERHRVRQVLEATFPGLFAA